MLMLAINIPYLFFLVKPRSQVTKTAVSIAVPIAVLLLVAIVAVLGLLGCVAYFKYRNKDFPFQFKYKKGVDDDLRTLDAPPENYNFESDEKSDLSSADKPQKDPDCSKKPVDSEPHLETMM